MEGKIYYKDIYEKILKDIVDGVYPPNAMLPFENELSAQYDVSITTIRHALKLLEDDHYIIKVKGKGSFVNPEIDTSSYNDDINCFGVLFFENRKAIVRDDYYHYSNLWSAKIYNSIFMKIKDEYTLIFDSMYEDEVVEKFKTHNTVLDNVKRILIISYSGMSPEILTYLESQGKQLIMYNYFNYAYKICNVLTNDREVYNILVRKLFKLNHERIAMINGAVEGPYRDSIERFMGYQEAFITKGRTLNEKLVKWSVSPRDAYYKMLEIFDLPKEEWPTAVVCVNDGVAIGVYEAIKEKGLRIPEDISVIGHDNDKIAAKMDPPLTSIDPMYDDIAKAIVSYFKRKIWTKRDRIVVKGKLIMRNSVLDYAQEKKKDEE